MYPKCKSLGLSLLAIVLFAGLVSSAKAQQVFGTIVGTVTDPSGGGVPNAKVTISDISKGTKFEINTNESGNYTKGQLIPGTYKVEVEAPGFSKAVSNDIIVNVDQTARFDITMAVGDVSQQIEVTAAAPLLQTDKADVAQTFSQKQLQDMPNFSRNLQSFELLSPGTAKLGWQHASSENPQGSVQIIVNGQHFSGTGFQLDGTDNQDPILGIIVINPAIDGVNEVKQASQDYDAEFSYTGAGLLTYSTKSGQNQIHGSAFEYLYNNSPGFQDFARNPFNSAENNGTPPVKYNQFGGSIGGRIIKDKLFFFGDAQLTRRRTGSSVLTTVPTQLARGGNFSEYINAGNNIIYDPATGNPATGLGRSAFPNNTIPTGRLSQQSLNMLQYFPLPNTTEPGSGLPWRNNFATTGSEAFDSNQWDTRWDYYLNEKNSFFGRYSYAAFNKHATGAFGELAGGPALNNIGFAGTSDVLNQSFAGGWTRTVSPTLINEFRFGYMRYRVNVLPNGLGTSPAADAGIPGLNLDDYFTSGMPAFIIHTRNGGSNSDPGYQSIGYSLDTNQCNCPLAQLEEQYQGTDNLTKIVGNHTLKFGADIRFAMNLRVPSDSHRAGELTFDPGFTGTNGGTSQGIGLATFMLGEATHFQRYVSPNTDARERQKRWFWYGQDTWRATPKLTINYGLRWEMVFPETVNNPGNGGQLDLRDGTIAVFGQGLVGGHGIQDMKYTNFAPRLGIAYQITPKTVVRAGYGWSYDLGTFGSIFGHNVTQNLPVLANQNLNQANTFSGVFDLATGPSALVFPTPDPYGRFPLPNNVNGKARPLSLVLPRVMAYNATVEQQVTKNVSVSAGYVGNNGRHVFNGNGPNDNVNQATWIPGIPNQNLRKPYFLPYGWTQGIDFYCNCATNYYKSFQTQFNVRNLHGYTLTGNYTYQVAVWDSDNAYTFFYDRPLGRGNEDFIPHNQLTLAQGFDVPFGRGRKWGSNANRWVDAILGGWNLSGITTFYSGRPYTVAIGSFPAGYSAPDVGPNQRPDRGTADPYDGAKKDRDQWFVGGLGGAFLLPAQNSFGNYGYNNLYGPIFINQDISVAKAFAITERFKFTIRGDAFNVFNHTNLGDPNTNIVDTNAGRITSLAPNYQMRRLQFSGRFDF